MSLSHGRGLFMTPGPSMIPDRVLNAMHRAAPNIYEGPLIETVDGILDNLKKVARTSDQASIYIANGHGVWEASLNNVVTPSQKVLALATGGFGLGWAATAETMGIEVQLLDFGATSGFDLERVKVALEADKSHEIKAVMAVQTDTSSSTNNDIPALRAAIDETGHPALLMVDCIASLACARFEMDEWGVDVMVAASQKGLMTPPGIAFTFHNEKAAAVSRTIPKTSPYWDWEPRVNGDKFYQKFGGTAPTHHLFGLEVALQMLVKEEGMEAVWERHAKQARAVWAAVDVWEKGDVCRCNVPDPANRSTAVTSIISDTHNLTELREWCEENGGLTLGIGLGQGPLSGDGVFRIGHMGHMDPPMLLGAIATIDAGMKALGMLKLDGAVDAAMKALTA